MLTTGTLKNGWIPSSPPDISPKEHAESAGRDYDSDDDESIESRYWKETRDPVQSAVPHYESADYAIPPSKTFCSQFSDTGLQIIVKIATTELTPDKPTFPAGSWHVEGQMNDHIVSTAIFYVDSENITPSHLYFRMPTESDRYEWQEHVGQDSYDWMEQVFGSLLGKGGHPCIQNYGSVETKEGRLLTFPNVFQHRVSGFELAEKTMPGHRRIIVLSLIDPRTRIISAANVPPQQSDWWVEQAFRNMKPGAPVPPEIVQLDISRSENEVMADILKIIGDTTLPVEVMDMVREELSVGGFLMNLEHAQKHRERLMTERSRVQDEVQKAWE